MSIERIIFSQANQEYKRLRADLLFLRRALETRLLGKFKFYADEKFSWESELEDEERPLLIKFPFESMQSYYQRYLLAFDGGESYRVLAEVIGHILRPGYVLNLNGFNEETQNKILTNIDNEGTGFANWLADVCFEIVGMGRATFITQTTPDGAIFTSRIKRESIRDYEVSDNNLSLIIYDSVKTERLQDYSLNNIEIATLISDQDWIYADKKTKKIFTSENPLGIVPVSDTWFNYDNLILMPVAKMQFILMNAESVLAQKIRNQAISILSGPQGIREQLRTISTNKVVEIPAEAMRSLEWVAYPASSLDADFKYMDFVLRRISFSGAVRTHYDSRQSGESKLWDFLSQRSLLEQIAGYVESSVNKTLFFWELLSGVQHVKNRFALNKNYDVHSLKETLELIFQAISLQLGETVETKLKFVARDALSKIGVSLSPEEIEKSNEEITNAMLDEQNLNLQIDAGGFTGGFR